MSEDKGKSIKKEAAEAELIPEVVEVEAVEAVTDDSVEENGSMETVIKNYLDESLFDDVKEVSPEEIFINKSGDELITPEVMSQYENTLFNLSDDRIIQGRVLGHNEKEVILDIGFKSEGIISREEFAGMEIPNIGDVVDVYLESVEDRSGQTVLSKEKADWMLAWNDIVEKHDKEENVIGTIVRRIKGGMVVDIGKVQGFLPGSQIDIRPIQDFDKYLGQEMEFKVVKVNQLRKNIVVSRKALLEDTLVEQRNAILKDIKVGQVLEGRVKNITDFGVFMDLGGVDGLLHVTDLSWGRINHPSEVVSLGDTIDVKVIGFDEEKQRISLGIKQLTPHPWDSVPEKYPIGTVVKGKVVSMTNYGAFIEIEKGVEGLVHVSEMSWVKNVHHPSEVVNLSDEVKAQVLSVNSEERKIALGFKQLCPDPWDGIEERYIVGSTHKGIVRNLTQFGAFVELEEGVDGLIHVSDLSWTKVVRHPKEVVEKNQEVEVKILEVSRENRRISLGLKQVQDDPWNNIKDHYHTGKVIEGEVIRVLDKGIILNLEMDVEGIIPSRLFSRSGRDEKLKTYSIGSTVKGVVQEVRQDDKKIVLNPMDESDDISAVEGEEVKANASEEADDPNSISEVDDKDEKDTQGESNSEEKSIDSDETNDETNIVEESESKEE